VVKDYLTNVEILDNRQDIIGQLSSFQASQPEEAAHGEEEQAAHQQPFIPVSRTFFLSGRGATGSPPGGSLTARQAAARHNNENHKGRTMR
jgi:hypothetical protein